MLKLTRVLVAALLTANLLFTTASPVWARLDSARLAQGAGEEIGRQLQAAGGAQGAGLGEPVDPRVTVVLLIRTVLRLLGLVLLVFIIYAGFLWMTAGGNEEQITKAKATIRNAVIGLIILLSAYSITIFAARLALGYGSSSIPFF